MSLLLRLPKLLPSWLVGEVTSSLALMWDDFHARARLALLARFPSHTPTEETLAAIGRDRRIIRGINEPAAAYAARLVRAPDDHRTKGNPYTMLEQLQAYLQAPCVVRTVDVRGNWFSIDGDGVKSSSLDTGNWGWDGIDGRKWSRFWVVIYPVDGVTPWAKAGKIGSATIWGNGKIGQPQQTIGTTATRDQVASVKSIIREWKPAGTKCEWIIIAFDAATFTPAGATDPNGEWGNWSDGAGQPVRLSTARYWRP